MSQQINLYSPIFLKREKHFSSTAMVQGLGLILLGLVAVYGYAWYQVRSLSQQTDDAQRHLQSEQIRLASVVQEFSPAQQRKQIESEANELEARVRTQQRVVDLLRENALGSTEGFSGYMRAFARQTVNGVWLTGFSIGAAGADMAVNGRTLRPDLLPAYLRLLNREPVLQGRQFAALEISVPKTDTGKGAPPFLDFRLQSSKPEQAKSK